MRQTVVARVLGIHTLVAVAGFAALAATTFLSLAADSHDRAVREIEMLAELAVNMVRSGLAPEAMSRAISDSSFAESVATIIDGDGTVVGGSNRIPPLPIPASELSAIERPVSGLATSPDTASRRVYAVAPVGAPDEPGRFVYVSSPLARPRTGTHRALIAVLTAAAVIAFIAGLLTYRSLRWIVKPIYAIQGAARRYAMGELTVQLRTNGPRELQRLVGDLNQMSLELRRRIGSISEQRNQLEVVLSSMVEGVIVLDERRGILRINEAAGRLLSVAVAEARGRTLIEYLRNAQLDEVAEQAYLSDQPSEHTITIYRDRPLHLQVHATPLRGDHASPRPIGSLLVISDITRLKHLEELRKDFVANVSHELKTPITSIKGFVETLLDDEDLDKPNRDRFLNIILHHSNRLHLIIEDLLSLSRLEQGNERITFSRFPVRELLSSVIDLTRQAAEERHIPVRVTMEGEPTAWGNPNLLEQALVNLLDNAIKYSPEGSSVEIIAQAEDDSLALRVIDQGTGIRQQDLPRVFERFYRTDAARSRAHGGTGLGLAIVKHIARAHGGEISVQSIVGQGSTFSLEIPSRSAQDNRQKSVLR